MAEEYDDQSDGFKNLRAQYEKLQKEKSDSDKLLNDLLRKDRTRTIADKLGEHKVNPKVANFVPDNVELDKLDVWLGENADVFGFTLQQENPQDTAENQAQQRISNLGNGSAVDTEPDLTAIQGAGSFEELTNIINNAVIGNR